MPAGYRWLIEDGCTASTAYTMEPGQCLVPGSIVRSKSLHLSYYISPLVMYRDNTSDTLIFMGLLGLGEMERSKHGSPAKRALVTQQHLQAAVGF